MFVQVFDQFLPETLRLFRPTPCFLVGWDKVVDRFPSALLMEQDPTVKEGMMTARLFPYRVAVLRSVTP